MDQKPSYTAEQPAGVGPSAALAHGLRSCLAAGELVLGGPRLREAEHDASTNRCSSGEAEALVLPTSTAEVASVLSWCYEHDVPIVPRGGGSGPDGGAVPDGAVIVSLQAMDTIRSIDPARWRMQAEAGVRTAQLRRIARENGLIFPPDPGGDERSTLGGSIATNSSGAHAFKYGATGEWVSGLEAVLPAGEIVRLGGSARTDIAGYNLVQLLTGSEGTLAIVTAAWLRLLPAPEAQVAVACFYPSAAVGCAAAASMLERGIEPAAIDYLDAGALAAGADSFPFWMPPEAAFALIVEADGHRDEMVRLARDLTGALGEKAVAMPLVLAERTQASQLWAWRDGVAAAVAEQRGGIVSEDVVVPFERLAEAIEGATEIGREQGLRACSWGEAGGGNLHAGFCVDRTLPEELERGERAAAQVLEMALALGGSIGGEHGVGAETGRVRQALDATTLELQAKVKRAFDPKLLLNPGKKVPGCGRGRI